MGPVRLHLCVPQPGARQALALPPSHQALHWALVPASLACSEKSLGFPVCGVLNSP